MGRGRADREADVGHKLASAGLGPEGHAFVWVTISSPVSVQTALDLGAGDRPPTRDPVLPAGVSHLWVASPYTSARSLAWSAGGRWRTLSSPWSDDGHLTLSQPS